MESSSVLEQNRGLLTGGKDVQVQEEYGRSLDIIKDYGADTLRMYEMFMGPLDQVKPWQVLDAKGIRGLRVWKLFDAQGAPRAFGSEQKSIKGYILR